MRHFAVHEVAGDLASLDETTRLLRRGSMFGGLTPALFRSRKADPNLKF